MLVLIAKKQDQTHLTAEHLEAGLKRVIDSLDQTCIDVPFASKLVRPLAESHAISGPVQCKGPPPPGGVW